MPTTSPTSAFSNVLRPEVEAHAKFMVPLKSRLDGISQTLADAYKQLGVSAIVGSTATSVDRIHLFCTIEHYTDEEYADLQRQCEEDGTDIADAHTHDTYFWDVEMDIEEQKFYLTYNTPVPEENILRHQMELFGWPKINISENDEEFDPEEGRTETIELSEEGYQELLPRLYAILKKFMSPELKIAYFQQSSRHQAQQMLNFVLE